jgi:putative ABC transport system ATP-binding protein
MITLRNVNRVYPLKGGPFYALRDINLEIKEGDFLSIMGPSGSGKSTLLHILGLHDSAWTGEYFLAGEPVHLLDKNCRRNTSDSFSRAITCWMISRCTKI